MKNKKWISFTGGFLVLFIVYHFPEFFSPFWITAVFKIGFLPVAFLVARMQGWKGLGSFGLMAHKGWWSNLAKGVGVGLFFFLLSQFISIISGQEKLISITDGGEIIRQLPLTLVMTLFPSIAEDILTRGYLFGHLHDKLKGTTWIFLSAIIFVANHIFRLDDGAAVLIYLFAMGLCLAWAVWYTRSLWLAFGLHWGLNIGYQSSTAFINTISAREGNLSTWIYTVVLSVMTVTVIALSFFWHKAPARY